MLRAISNYMKGIPPVYIDGALYSGILIFGFLQAYLSTDDAEKYIPSHVLFYLNGFVGMATAWFGGIKMFRSNSFTDHQKQKAIEAGNTTVISKTTTTQP